ncbi:MAG: hypothetical protein QM589_02560 [Thermomicrobiales bacterium]
MKRLAGMAIATDRANSITLNGSLHRRKQRGDAIREELEKTVVATPGS